MSGKEKQNEGEQARSLSKDELREYVRDVMGWTAYQAEAYVAVVQHGPLEPKEIVARTDVPQGRVYNVMGQLEGEAVNVQGRQPKRYKAHHPRSVLGDKQEAFNNKADSATNHLEQRHEIQEERHDVRHPAWVIPGIAGTKRELLEGIRDIEDRVLLMEQDGSWIQNNEIRDISRLAGRGVDVEVIGWSSWSEKLVELAEEDGVTAWEIDRVESSFALIDDDIVIMRVGRGDTGVKLQDEGTVNILHKAFEASRNEATEV